MSKLCSFVLKRFSNIIIVLQSIFLFTKIKIHDGFLAEQNWFFHFPPYNFSINLYVFCYQYCPLCVHKYTSNERKITLVVVVAIYMNCHPVEEGTLSKKITYQTPYKTLYSYPFVSLRSYPPSTIIPL